MTYDDALVRGCQPPRAKSRAKRARRRDLARRAAPRINCGGHDRSPSPLARLVADAAPSSRPSLDSGHDVHHLRRLPRVFHASGVLLARGRKRCVLEPAFSAPRAARDVRTPRDFAVAPERISFVSLAFGFPPRPRPAGGGVTRQSLRRARTLLYRDEPSSLSREDCRKGWGHS